jgi:GH35 family endo-1,4-beta-xylanase
MYNEVVFENDLKWESFVNKTTTQKNDMIKVLNDLDSRNIKMRGHNVLWPSWTYNPVYLAGYKTNPDKLRMEIDKRIDNVCTFTRGRLIDWDVINEPYSEHDWMDILGKDAMADWFKRVRNNDPYVKLYLNDFAILSSNGTNVPKQDAYIETVKYIDGLGGGVQGIGFQGHFGSDLTPIPRLKTILDKFSVLNKEIKVTEFDVDVTQQAVQADYTRDFMTMLFSHPSVTGILSWGFWASRHWKPTAALYNADWSIRPNGLVYRDLVLNQWWTKDSTLISNDTGMVNFNGFLGSYKYKVKYDGNERTGSFDVLKPVSEGVPNEFIISTDTLVPAELKVKILGGTVLCEGDSTHLSLNLAPGFSIKWFNNKAILPENSARITVKSTGMYSAEAKGKGVTLLSSPINITVNAYPPATIDTISSLTFCPGGSVVLNAGVEVPFTYKWFKNGTYFAGSTTEILVSESGKYKVEANSYGCKSFSPELTVTKLSALDALCSSGIIETEKQMTIFPNPFKQAFYIDASDFDIFPVEIELLDTNGKIIYQSILTDPVKSEVKPDIANGFYILKMQAQNKVHWIKVIRQY